MTNKCELQLAKINYDLMFNKLKLTVINNNL